jgi:hypothetical protein
MTKEQSSHECVSSNVSWENEYLLTVILTLEVETYVLNASCRLHVVDIYATLFKNPSMHKTLQLSVYL